MEIKERAFSLRLEQKMCSCQLYRDRVIRAMKTEMFLICMNAPLRKDFSSHTSFLSMNYVHRQRTGCEMIKTITTVVSKLDGREEKYII